MGEPLVHQEEMGKPLVHQEEKESTAPLTTESLHPSLQSNAAASTRPKIGVRRSSLQHGSQTGFPTTLLESNNNKLQLKIPTLNPFGGPPPTISPNMLHRKIWVKRPGSSATLVTIKEDDLVDDAREVILRKYSNSLGRNFDAPEVTLRIIPREPIHPDLQTGERTLGPEKPMSRTLDSYFPGGQSVDEALLIDVPQRRTPQNSPHHPVTYHMVDDLRPSEAGSDYFPLMTSNKQQLPSTPPNTPQHPVTYYMVDDLRPDEAGSDYFSLMRSNKQQSPHLRTSLSVPAMPVSTMDFQSNRAQTPPPSSLYNPRPKIAAHQGFKRGKEHPRLPSGLLDGAFSSPINVLIVEDNILDLKVIEAYMKRLKVRWQSAMDGRDAVTKWRAGGFNLVLMDVQLPVMNGLDATREIRRLERLNDIGIFYNGANTPTVTLADDDGFVGYLENEQMEGKESEPTGDDVLTNTSLFQGPVIIVALTASSLQSRHEALAAGCNDFLTKPVTFVWLKRKVIEWGCMQALINFER